MSYVARAAGPARRAAHAAVVRPFSTRPAPRAKVAAATPPPPRKPPSPDRKEHGVGEMEQSAFRVEPLRRVGEAEKTMRARLTYMSRKRGTLESDLLLSTFADAYLPTMSAAQMRQYDLFLDENDWDIYYWATQQEGASASSQPTSAPPQQQPLETADPGELDSSSPSYQSADAALAARSAAAAAAAGPVASSGEPLSGDSGEGKEEAPLASSTAAAATPSSSSSSSPSAAVEPWKGQEGRSNAAPGEWAQTVGAFRPAYRPVPARWRDSEVLALLREHVRRRSRGGGGGMAFMPALRG